MALIHSKWYPGAKEYVGEAGKHIIECAFPLMSTYIVEKLIEREVKKQGQGLLLLIVYDLKKKVRLVYNTYRLVFYTKGKVTSGEQSVQNPENERITVVALQVVIPILIAIAAALTAIGFLIISIKVDPVQWGKAVEETTEGLKEAIKGAVKFPKYIIWGGALYLGYLILSMIKEEKK